MKVFLIILTMLASSCAYSHYSPIITELDANVYSKTKDGTIKPTPQYIKYFCNISADLYRNIAYNLLVETNELYMNYNGIRTPKPILLDITDTFEYKILKINQEQYSKIVLELAEDLKRVLKETPVQPRDFLREMPITYIRHCLESQRELIVNYNKIFE